MKEMGFLISLKENEKRRALLPSDINYIKNKHMLFFERGYGEVLGISDNEYIKKGVNVVTREKIYEKDIICCLKTPEKFEYKYFSEGQTLFGWIHAVQGVEITNFLVEKKMTAYAWEDMFEKGRHIFYKNNEIAGEASVWHALLHKGSMMKNLNVAVLGQGNTARGAIRLLEKLGHNVTIYNRNTLSVFKEKINKYDIVVNAVLWDVFLEDRIIYKDDLKKMRKNSLIIDISCNDRMEIETAYPTPLSNPMYLEGDVWHYTADHTPSLFWMDASESISNKVKLYIDPLVENTQNDVLEAAEILRCGKIMDKRIIKFQERFIKSLV
ncbi:N(5)-(carboxyethyl)ornithine synthase [Priestia koreensis]|uniref:N(5)-(carboxyethyl)ornithine synthase n=1 Tax=Priestia koreensis TaxID=284581 RepID=UPI001F5A3947|nr:N(5)-(carboxyethyl)ornithine synthase [Priestia koreensis]UNL85796.1 N(5)-(carboxyethyl)ornithine synthase [Priestia koreensis]